MTGEPGRAALRDKIGEEGGIIGDSSVREKLGAAMDFTGVCPMVVSIAAEAWFGILLMKLFRGAVDGTDGPTLDGGTISSVEGKGMSAGISGPAAKTSLKR